LNLKGNVITAGPKAIGSGRVTGKSPDPVSFLVTVP